MAAKGRTLVEERFTRGKVAAQMKEVYAWMLGEGEKPGCVDWFFLLCSSWLTSLRSVYPLRVFVLRSVFS